MCEAYPKSPLVVKYYTEFRKLDPAIVYYFLNVFLGFYLYGPYTPNTNILVIRVML